MSKTIKKKTTTKRTKKKTTFIDKIKKNEKKYTMILVLFFMVLFCIIGFLTLKIQNDIIYKNEPEEKEKNVFPELTSYGQTITLNSNSIMSDEKGLESPNHIFNIQMTGRDSLKYRVRLVKNNDMLKKYNYLNKLFNYKMIKYSLDGINVSTFKNEDMVLKEGILNKDAKENIFIKLWVDNKIAKINDFKFYGYFEIEEFN